MDADGRILPVLLSGGAGTRLWPLSRAGAPKQLIRLLRDRTLFQEAVVRTAEPRLFDPPLVIAGAAHRFLVAEQLRALGVAAARIALEPTSRNTAAAAAAAAMLAGGSSDRLLLLAPADHLIDDVAAFHATLASAVPAASEGLLALIGIAPDAPATGYGYIQPALPIDGCGAARRVARFVEKPDRTDAETYLQRGYLWNSGMVLARRDVLLGEIERFEPALAAAMRQAAGRGKDDGTFLWLDDDAYRDSPSISLDHAVLERSDKAAVVAARFAWRDVGSWSSLMEASPRDADGNAVDGNVVLKDTANCYIRSEGPLVAALGLENLVIIATRDAVLVARADRDQDIRALAEEAARAELSPQVAGASGMSSGEQ